MSCYKVVDVKCLKQTLLQMLLNRVDDFNFPQSRYQQARRGCIMRASSKRNYWSQDQQRHSQWPKTYENPIGREVTSVEHRASWDGTISAPKSVSLTALVLSELEQFTQKRIGNVHKMETTRRFVAATFEHNTARPVDGYAAPQLHTHAVIFNVTERDSGPGKLTRSVQSHELCASQKYVTAVYRSELATRLQGLGYELERGEYGQPEIKGYTKEYLEPSPGADAGLQAGAGPGRKRSSTDHGAPDARSQRAAVA